MSDLAVARSGFNQIGLIVSSYIVSVNTCAVPTVTNATPVPASSVDYDSNVTYTCEDGYTHTAGDLTRSCNADGSLTGATPVCTSELQLQC